MKITSILAGVALAAMAAGAAVAGPINQDEPSGNVILDLNGTVDHHAYTQYFASFTATDASTNLTFAFREDPAFLFLDDVVLTHGGGPNLVTNGGFEDGPNGASAPNSWTYLNAFGASFGGVVSGNNPHSGSLNYYDGAVQAYDAITQNIATVSGEQYDLSFWLADNSDTDIYRRVSTNGDVTDTGGNGINLVVYAGGIPVRSGTPEPATWGLMLVGFGGLGAMLRRRKAALA
jgi:hypothetical protein